MMNKSIYLVFFIFGFFSFDANAQCGNDTSLTMAVSEVIMPNVFSPNNDGVNDGFNVSGGCILSVDKKIYNRYGTLVFDSKQINEIWNGRTITGKEVPEGTYFYIFNVEMLIDSSSTFKAFKGSLSLLR